MCFRFQALPSSLYDLKKLEIILASDNHIENIDVSGLSTLPVLAVLDLHNNNIKIVPPELGNMSQLRYNFCYKILLLIEIHLNVLSFLLA